jgi:hypothetical protein
MADNNLHTLKNAVEGIDKIISAGDNLPEWCQEKIAVAEHMLVSVWDYMQGEQDSEQGVAEELSDDEYDGTYSPEAIKIGRHLIKTFNLTDELDQQLAIEIVDNEISGGETDLAVIKKQVIKYLRKSGTVIQPRKEQAVAEASALEKFRKGAAEREKKHADTEKEMNARHARGEEDMKGSIDRLEKHINTKEGLRDPKDNPCWKGYKPVGTKKKGSKTVPNCVPKEGWTHDSLAAELFETENTYEDRLSNLLNKQLGK